MTSDSEEARVVLKNQSFSTRSGLGSSKSTSTSLGRTALGKTLKTCFEKLFPCRENRKIDGFEKSDISHNVFMKTSLDDLRIKFKTVDLQEVQDARLPYHLFANEQFNMTVKEITESTAEPAEAVIQTKENIENLIALIDLLFTYDQKNAAKALSDNVFNLLTQITPVMMILEAASKTSPTDWTALAHAVKLPDTSVSTVDINLEMLDVTDRELLGYGGMGTVHKVKFVGHSVAMKMSRFYEAETNDFSKSAIAGSLLRHPLIVRQIASFPTTVCQLTLYEYIEGVNLSELRESVFMPYEAMKVIAAQLCLAVSYMHRMGVLHMDIKPSNLVVQKQCRIKLIDFDFAKICIGKFVPRRKFITFDNRRCSEFCDSQRRGTGKYMAPEVWDMKTYGRASDWFTTGRTIYETYVDCFPYRKDKSEKRETRKIEDHLQNLIDQLTDSNPSSRLVDIDTIRTHPFFDDVDWDVCESGQVRCDLLDDMIRVVTWPLNHYEKREQLQSLDPAKPGMVASENGVLKVLSSGFCKAVEKHKAQQPVSINDILPEFDMRKEIEDVPSLLGYPDGLKARLKLRVDGKPTKEDWAELRKN